MDKALSYMAIARKAGRIETGNERVDEAMAGGRCKLLMVSADAPDKTLRFAELLIEDRKIPLITLPFSADEIGQTLGRGGTALAAVTDIGLAIEIVSAIPGQEDMVSQLKARQERYKKRKNEKGRSKDNLKRRSKESSTGNEKRRTKDVKLSKI